MVQLGFGMHRESARMMMTTTMMMMLAMFRCSKNNKHRKLNHQHLAMHLLTMKTHNLFNDLCNCNNDLEHKHLCVVDVVVDDDIEA